MTRSPDRNDTRLSIPVRSVHEAPEALANDLDEAGCLVVKDVLSAAALATVRAELTPLLAAAGVSKTDKPDDFYPAHTRRVTALVARSEGVRDLILHPVSRSMRDHHLGAGAGQSQIHVTAGLEVGPGARRQVLHREEDSFPFFPLPRPNLILASMWAISDFRADNGGTLLVPGSHRWSADRTHFPSEVVAAEMPAGSLLFWLGGTLHGAGANTSTTWRQGVILTYSLGWLRQEENQCLDVTPELAMRLPAELQALVGYQMHGSLGFYDPTVRDEPQSK